jgi:hypothetical protein
MWAVPLIILLLVGGCCRYKGSYMSTGPKEKVYHDLNFDSKAIQVV